MRSRYLTHDVTFVRDIDRVAHGKTVRDAWGNPLTDPQPYTVTNCTWEPRYALEDEEVGSEKATGSVLLYSLQVDADVRHKDRATLDGLTYQVYGPAQRQTGSRLDNDHLVIELRRVTD